MIGPKFGKYFVMPAITNCLRTCNIATGICFTPTWTFLVVLTNRKLEVRNNCLYVDANKSCLVEPLESSIEQDHWRDSIHTLFSIRIKLPVQSSNTNTHRMENIVRLLLAMKSVRRSFMLSMWKPVKRMDEVWCSRDFTKKSCGVKTVKDSLSM